MSRIVPLGAAVVGMTVASLATVPPASAQVHVAVGVGIHAGPHPYYYRPYYPFYGPYFYGAWWYPGFYGYYGYPYPYYGYGYGYGYLDGSSLRLEVKPKQTQVFIDGSYAGTVDDFDGFFQRLNVEPGDHELQLYLPGYRLEQQHVYLQPGKTFRVRYMMVPLAPGETEPPRPTPATAPTAPPASAVTASPGPATRGPERSVPPPRDERRLPPPASASSPGSSYGTLALRVQPGDAAITIDGERWESSGDDRLLVQLSAGVHHLEARKDGYRVYATDVTVRPGETATLNVALSRQP